MITIVNRSAVRTHPASYSKLCDTFRPRGGQTTARRAQLGTPSLVDFHKDDRVPQGFVAELVAQRRPTGIKHGFGHPCFGQAARADIADGDQAILSHEAIGDLVQVMFSGPFDFSMDCARWLLRACSLCASQRCGMLTADTDVPDLLASRERRQCRQTEIDANLAGGIAGRLLALALQIKEPAASPIGCKTAGFDFPVDGSAEPQPITTTKEDGGIAVALNGARSLKRHPTQSFLPAPSGRRRILLRGAANSLQTA